jgi:hypothetical protein
MENKPPGYYEARDFLKENGFDTMTSDGQYFLDEFKNKYMNGERLLGEIKYEPAIGGKIEKCYARGVRDIKPSEDIFVMKYEEYIYNFGANFFDHEDIEFVGKSPLKSAYNAAVLSPISTYSIGCGEISLFSVLMLKRRTEFWETFIKDKTEEEIRLEEIERQRPAF